MTSPERIGMRSQSERKNNNVRPPRASWWITCLGRWVCSIGGTRLLMRVNANKLNNLIVHTRLEFVCVFFADKEDFHPTLTGIQPRKYVKITEYIRRFSGPSVQFGRATPLASTVSRLYHFPCARQRSTDAYRPRT